MQRFLCLESKGTNIKATTGHNSNNDVLKISSRRVHRQPGNSQVEAWGSCASVCGLHLGACKPALNKRLTCMSLMCYESTRRRELCKQAAGKIYASRRPCGERERHPEVAFLPAGVSQGDRRSRSCVYVLPAPAPKKPHATLASSELTGAKVQRKRGEDAEELSRR